MKTAIFLFFVLVMYATIAKAGLPPTNLKGQSDTSAKTTFFFQTPSKQSTQVAPSTGLIETGNTNILENPSFEHSTATTGWSSAVTGTATNTLTAGSNSTNELGAKRLNFSCAGGASGGTCTISQDQNTSKTVQGLALAYISTDTPSGVKLKPRANGAEIIGLEVSAQTTSEALYKVPFTLGSSSSGLEVEITVSAGATITGTVDAAFVGAVDLKADVDASRYLGGVTYGAGASATGWRNYSGTGTLISGSQGFSYNDTTKVITLAEAGDYKIDFVTAYTVSTASSGLGIALTINGLTEQCGEIALGNADTGGRPKSTCNLKNLPAGSTIILRQYTGSSLAAAEAVVQIFKFASGSGYTSTNADTDWASCNFSTLAWNGLGTVTSSLECKRQGSDLLMRGSFVPGTTSANEARIPLPLWNGVQLTNSKDGYVGDTFRNVAGANSNRDYIGLVTSGQAYVKIGIREYASTAASLTVQNGPALVNSGETMPVEFRIPISGWTNSNLIIGQFNELMVTPNVSKPKTCYYAFGGASATLASPTNCTGTCTEVIDTCGVGSIPTRSGTGLYTNLTLASGTFANNSYIKCDCESYDTGTGARDCVTYFDTGDHTWSSSATGSAVLNIATTNTAGTLNDSYVSVKCEGQAP